MKTNDKSKEQLIEEIHQLTVKVAELEKSKMELKQVERTLGEERNLLRTLIDNVPDHIYAKDTKCRYFVSNRAHKRFLNVETEEDIIGKSVFDLYSQEMAEHYYADDQQVIRSGQPIINREEKSVNESGENVWNLTTKVPLKNRDGKIMGLVGIAMDITGRKQAEQALKESEAKYRTIIENSGDAIAIRQKGKFVFANKAFSKMLDYSIIELLEIENSLIFDSDILSDMEKRISKNDLNENLSIQFETKITKKDKTKIDVEIFEKIISYKEEKAQLTMVRDITKQKAIMKDLQRGAEQTKGLNEFIPICAGCSKIRDDEKENKPWVKPSDYISERLPDIQFSHGMCPDCMKKWYPNLLLDRK